MAAWMLRLNSMVRAESLSCGRPSTRLPLKVRVSPMTEISMLSASTPGISPVTTSASSFSQTLSAGVALPRKGTPLLAATLRSNCWRIRSISPNRSGCPQVVENMAHSPYVPGRGGCGRGSCPQADPFAVDVPKSPPPHRLLACAPSPHGDDVNYWKTGIHRQLVRRRRGRAGQVLSVMLTSPSTLVKATNRRRATAGAGERRPGDPGERDRRPVAAQAERMPDAAHSRPRRRDGIDGGDGDLPPVADPALDGMRTLDAHYHAPRPASPEAARA